MQLAHCSASMHIYIQNRIVYWREIGDERGQGHLFVSQGPAEKCGKQGGKPAKNFGKA